ncbi:flagellar hook-length control protein FliK, partial [Calidifontimicrobium sp. SYSU G02091]|uniref:flagellar hook-length control protein FliK n=1 Tax=Calidifontimicrobium sp. SYSU G02091 TaxID=2926421 RepID=UPI001F52E16F
TTGDLPIAVADTTDGVPDAHADGPARRTAHAADRGMAARTRDAQSDTPSSATPQVAPGDEAPRAPATAAAVGRAAAEAAPLAGTLPPAAKSPTEATAPTVVATVAADATAPATAPTGAPAPLPEARLPHPLPSPAFAPALGQQVALWVRQGVPQAMLQLNPAELGPVAVRIALDGTQAHVDFTALHAATRDALEASLPALASALRDSGLTLAGGGVFDRPREQRDDSQAGDAASGGTRAPAARGATGEAADARPAPRRRGIVDLVA